jgi:hypothetical protein
MDPLMVKTLCKCGKAKADEETPLFHATGLICWRGVLVGGALQSGKRKAEGGEIDELEGET